MASAEATVRASIDEGHALVDGKWLVNVFAPTRLGPAHRPQTCRDAWIVHAATSGGLAEVRGLWERIVRRPP